MNDLSFEVWLKQFERALQDCQRLYLSSARLCVEQFPGFLPGTPEEFLQLMDDLHKGLLIKIYVEIVQADGRWSREEKKLGTVLFNHIWPGEVSRERLRDAANHVFREAAKLKWYSLVRPFEQIKPLREKVGELETVVTRVANLVAKSDGDCSLAERARLQVIQEEISRHVQRVKLDEASTHEEASTRSAQAVQQLQEVTEKVRVQCEVQSQVAVQAEHQSQEERLGEAIARLDALIGLEKAKHEIRTLTNFLRLQRQRVAAGLPQTELSLHMVFGGNPGTGKTTVARIVGQIYGSMGILKKGHLIETDRSGLVAEYAGQTGPKTNKRIDEALDGVLFVDEAYSLVAKGDDPFGREAVQSLLKRMEDDRNRLVVILAGYPGEMDVLIRSNPGLSSRFNTKLVFEDYKPGELGEIFGSLCEHNHYQVKHEARIQLLLGFKWLYDHRTKNFGNGRLVRNAFETSIRRLANRISGVTRLTEELLTTLEATDVALDDLPAELLSELDAGQFKFQIRCPGCRDVTEAPAEFLGRPVRCKGCEHRFVANWAEPVESV